MHAVIKLEIIGEPYHWMRRNRHKALIKRTLLMREEINLIRYGHKKHRPWVARITGLDDRYEFRREFVECVRDWSDARSNGIRGIYEYFALPPGIYQVNECIRLGKSRRYFIRVEGTEYEEITREEVEQWLLSNC